jgi:hypothetical protein
VSALADLPEILTRSDLAALVGREPRSIEQMAARGLAAASTHRHRGKPAWEEQVAMGWFRTLHEHAVIVPGGEPTLDEAFPVRP